MGLNKKIEKKESWVSFSIDPWTIKAGKDPGYCNPILFGLQVKFMQTMTCRTGIRFQVFIFSVQCSGHYTVFPEVGILVFFVYEIKRLLPTLI